LNPLTHPLNTALLYKVYFTMAALTAATQTCKHHHQ